MRIPFFILLLIGVLGCQEEVDLDLPEQPPEIVVEGFINSEFPMMNYVVLSRVQSFSEGSGQEIFVEDAEVYVTPGEEINGEISWEPENRVELESLGSNIDSVDFGFYFDLSGQLEGEEGKHYRLEVFHEDETLTSKTYIPHRVEKDTDYRILESDEGDEKRARFTVRFQDPPGQRSYYRQQYLLGGEDMRDMETPGLWGRMSGVRILTDDEFQGQEVNFTYPVFFNEGDTIHHFLNTIDENCYDYMRSMFDAANTGGPFASPVQIESNVEGGKGGFCGMGVSYKKVIIEP